MRRIALVLMFLFITTSAFAGNKVFTENDLEEFSNKKPAEIHESHNEDGLNEISMSDLEDITAEIKVIETELMELRNKRILEMSNKCVLTSANIADEECAKTVWNKYAQKDNELEMRLLSLEKKYVKLQAQYDAQEARKKRQ